MVRQRIGTVSGAAAACVASVLAGCRQYQPRPLDVDGARSAWLARTGSEATVAALAERLRGETASPDGGFDTTDGLSLDEAEAVALVFNRELRVARAEAGVLAASAAHAGVLDDPVLGIDLERVISGVPDPWVVGGTLGLTIPLSARLAAERSLGEGEHATSLARVAAQEWRTRVALRERWIEWSGASVEAGLTREFVDRLGEVARLADQQAGAGVLSAIDARLFRVELATARADLGSLEARAAELELDLRALMGLGPAAPVTFVAVIERAVPLGTPSQWASLMESRHPDLVALRADYEASERSLRLEVERQYPDLQVGPGLAEDTGDQRVLLGLSLPVPAWNRNRQGVARAEAQRDASRARFEAGLEDLGSHLALAEARFASAQRLRRAIESDLVPLADEQEADVRRVASLGRVEPLLLLQTLQSRHAALSRLIGARVQEAMGSVVLEGLLGPPEVSGATVEGGGR